MGANTTYREEKFLFSLPSFLRTSWDNSYFPNKKENMHTAKIENKRIPNRNNQFLILVDIPI